MKLKAKSWPLYLAAGMAIALACWAGAQGGANPPSLDHAPEARSALLSSGGAPRGGAADYIARIAVASSTVDAANPLARFTPDSSIEGLKKLETIRAQGVPMTAQFVTAVRSLLKDASGQEKMALIRILGSLYAPDDVTGYNGDILLDLRALTENADKDIAKTAAIAFARIGYLPGTDSLLRSTFQSGVLNADDYYGELARLVFVAPPEARASILAQIPAASDPQASDKLAEAVDGSPDAIHGLSTETKAALADVLRAGEPLFGQQTWDFGVADAARYGRWLRAVARLEDPGDGASMDANIVARLSRPDTDPRKVLAYLLMPQASRLLAPAAPNSAVEGLVVVASRYATQVPENPVSRQFMQSIASGFWQDPT